MGALRYISHIPLLAEKGELKEARMKRQFMEFSPYLVPIK